MKTETKKYLLTVLIGLNLALIWGNSALTGQQSGDMSSSILAQLIEFFPFLAGENGHFLLRKLAHFSEFASLGFLSAGRGSLGGRPLRPGIAGAGLAAACIDETIQLYVPGRASSLIDVWIDTAGFMTGCAVFALGHILYKAIKKSKMKTLEDSK